VDGRKQFFFQLEYYEAIKKLPANQFLKAFKAIVQFSLYGDAELLHEKGKYSKAHEAVISILPLMKAERRRSKEGRSCSEYKTWRASVFQRDKYKCQLCGSRGGRLNAHHIKRYSDFPDLRYEIDNGVTLCESCHKEVHRLLRKGESIEWHG
jgi:predicted restriction endonuclease